MSVTIIRQDTRQRWTVDHVESESWDKPLNVTDHPVDDNSNTTDHAQQDPLEVSFTAFVSEVAPPRGFRPNEPNRHLKALEFFRGLAEDVPPVTVVSQERGAVRDMVVQGRPYTFDNRRGVEIDLSFKKLEFAVAERVEIPPEQPPPDQSGQADDQDQGKNGTEDGCPLSEEDKENIRDQFEYGVSKENARDAVNVYGCEEEVRDIAEETEKWPF
jgi:hypothetical protein